MIVLTIIVALVFALIIFVAFARYNQELEEKYGLTLFSFSSYFAIGIPFLMLYFGYTLRLDALKATHGDPLNGLILMGIGAVLLLIYLLNSYVDLANKSRADDAVLILFLRCIVYIPLSFLGAIALVLAVGFFSQTKPVYDISSKD